MQCPKDNKQMYRVGNCDDHQIWECSCGKEMVQIFNKPIIKAKEKQMGKKELERRIYELEKWTLKFYEAIKIIQKKTGVELTETKSLLESPPYIPGR